MNTNIFEELLEKATYALAVVAVITVFYLGTVSIIDKVYAEITKESDTIQNLCKH